MSEKLIPTINFGDYEGINGESTAIEKDSPGFNRAINYEPAIGNSLRGRLGCQVAAQAMGFFGMFSYVYTRTQDEYALRYAATSLTSTKLTADGSTVLRLVGINNQGWVLSTMSIPLTYVAGTYPFTIYTTVIGSLINLVIKANGVSILTTSLGDGVSSNTSIWSLLSTIDALAELSVSRTTRGTCPPFAIIDGNQTAVPGAFGLFAFPFTITVKNTPHNFYPGDVIYFPNHKAGLVALRTATTIVFYGDTNDPWTFNDGDVLGYMNQSAAGIVIGPATSFASGNLTLNIPYWRNIVESDTEYGEVFADARNAWANKSIGSIFAHPTAVNDSGCLYIASSVETSRGIRAWPIAPFTYTTCSGNLVKFDGQNINRAGLPSHGTITITPTAGGVLTGAYKYKAFLRRRDAQGNIIDGALMSTTVTTLAAQYSTIVINQMYLDYASFGTGFNVRYAEKTTTQAPAAGASFSIISGSSIQPGDPVCYVDDLPQKTGGGGANTGIWITGGFGATAFGALHVTVCTAYDGSTAPKTMKVADSNGLTTIQDLSDISAGMTVVVLRSAAGGNNFYILTEAPFDCFNMQVDFLDNVNDSILIAGEQYVEVPLGKEHNEPPLCSLVCSHQGGLVVARGANSPNTISFSTADGNEYFPIASNSLDVPSGQSGAVTSIASDQDDRLAVCKRRAYYDVVGVLDDGTFSINIRNEGDYGITSQASLTRVNGELIGLSQNGYVSIYNGILNPYKFKELNTRLINQNYYFDWAVAYNDPTTRQYICSIPTPSGTSVSHVIDYSRPPKINKEGDVLAVKTFERNYSSTVDQGGGMCVLDNEVYHLSQASPFAVFKRLPRFNGDSPGAGNGDSFIDNVLSIPYVLETNPLNFGDPTVLKSVIRVRVWSLPNDYILEGWVPFSVLVETGASAEASFIGGANPNASSSTLTFAAISDLFKDAKLASCRSLFFMLRFTTNTVRTAPFLSGYSLMLADDYTKEDLIK